MAISIDKTLTDSASEASFEISGTGGDTVTIAVADLSGAGATDNQSVIVTKVFATVARSAAAAVPRVTLSWGGDGMFLVLPEGHSQVKESFRPVLIGGGDGNIVVESAANTLFSLKIFVRKATGYPLSMGSAINRP